MNNINLENELITIEKYIFLKKQSPEQRRPHAENLLPYCLLLVTFFACISCNHQPSSNSQNNPVNRPPAINNIRKASFDAPRVIPITSHNQAKVVRAGKPVIIIDSSNGGASFFTNNIQKHAMATEVTINLEAKDNDQSS